MYLLLAGAMQRFARLRYGLAAVRLIATLLVLPVLVLPVLVLPVLVVPVLASLRQRPALPAHSERSTAVTPPAPKSRPISVSI